MNCVLDIEDRSKLPNTTPIKDQIPQYRELYQCLKNTVKELGGDIDTAIVYYLTLIIF